MSSQLTISGQRLEVEQAVGRGATSVVWRCRRLDHGDLCALKVARRAGDQMILADEAERLLWGVSPSLPRLLGLGRIPGSRLGDEVIEDAPCLLLDWLEGTTLGGFVAGVPVVEQRILLGFARDIANTLSDLHAAGIAHGDIKPDNVMVVQKNGGVRAVLLDMGLSAAADSAVPRGGTFRYLAPEALSTAAEGDGRTRDLWALGLLLAELVDRRYLDTSPAAVARSARALGPIGDIIEPLLATCPGARPPASWVSMQVDARIGTLADDAELLSFRQARVRRAYLNVRRAELVAAARSRSISIQVEQAARNWVEDTLGMLVGIDAMRGIGRSDRAATIGNLGSSARLRFVVDLVGSVAASWPVDPQISDAELLERILVATRVADPHALTLATIAQQGSITDEAYDRSPLELALLLNDGLPRRDLLDAAESYSLREQVPVAFRLALGRRLRLVGEYGRSLAVLDRDSSPQSRAEAAETARRARDIDGALERIRALDDTLDLSARARAAATEARILIDRRLAADALTRLKGVPESAHVLEVRALAELQLERHAAALETLERARATATSDEDQARIQSLLGILHHATAEGGLSVLAFRRAVEYAGRAGALLEEATYLTGLAAAAVDSCLLDEAVVAAERATALFEALGQPSSAARAALNRVAAFAVAGSKLQAHAAAQAALVLARAVKDDRCAAYVHLALVDATDCDPEAAEHAQRAASLLTERTTDEELMVLSRCHECNIRVNIDTGDVLARQADIGRVATLDWWGARARRALRDRDVRGAEWIVGELGRLLQSRVSAAIRGRAFSAGAELATLAQLGDAARRLHVAAVEDLQQLVSGCSADLRSALMARDWVKALRAPAASLLLPEQVADIETLVRALGRWEKLRPLLVQVLDALVLWTGVERGLMLLSAPGGRLQARVGRNISRSDLVGHQLELSHSLAARALEQGEPIVAVDASGELDSVHESVHALKLRSVLAVPLLARGSALGVVYLDDRIRRGAFGAKELAWVRLVAAVAAVAIADARDRLRLRRAARRAERAEKHMAEMLAVREAELGEARVELARTTDRVPTRHRYDGIIGNSQAMQQLLRLVDRVVVADVPVLVLGGSGTGKELVARAIHKNGPRSPSAFVAENCGAIPEPLLESALFGHVKGAFTGAARTRAGLFEVADQGTLFLDEIAEMSLGMQTKLLRVLEEGEFWPVGSERSKRVDVRIIAATHRDIEAMVAAGTFRQDLFYRLNVVSLQIPALKDRHGDIPLLVRHFVERHGEGRNVAIDNEALELLCRYPWPGNVRQLENEIRRALVLSEDRITSAQLSDEVRRVALQARPQPEGLDLRAHLDALERELVTKALERTNGNQTRAAELLGVSRFGLQKMVRRLEIRAPGSAPPPPMSRPEATRPVGPKAGRGSVEF
jgi:serine/threonine-protein kinase PknK